MANKTLIIGLDGATFDLILPWSRSGHLPTLTHLMQEGAYGVLNAFPNLNSAAAWTSIVTGCNPGKHGIFDFGNRVRLSEQWHPITARDRRRDPFWLILSRAGKRVGVMNVPISYPADPINGFMLSGMDAPGTTSRGFAHPPALLDELRRTGIEYILDVPNLKEVRRRQAPHMPPMVRAMVEARTQAFLYALERFECEVGMVVFVATDRMHHYYWGDSDTPDDTPSWIPLRELYMLLDACIARILAHVGSDTNVLVISDHGSGRSQNPGDNLDRILQGTGLLSIKSRQPSLRGIISKYTLQYGRRFLPPPLQYWLATRFPKWRLRAWRESKFAHVDWTCTKVSRGGGGSSMLSVNLRGRDPQGSVPPDEYDAVCEQAQAILSELTDPDTGKPVVRRVWQPKELYAGPFAENGADLCIQWDQANLRNGLCYRGRGEPIVARAQPHSENQFRGSHRPEGILIAHGPQIRRGVILSPLHQYDIAPTVLYLQGQPIPADLDGQVLADLVEPQELQRHPVQTTAHSTISIESDAGELDVAAQAQIEERLRGLGYIE